MEIKQTAKPLFREMKILFFHEFVTNRSNQGGRGREWEAGKAGLKGLNAF